MNRSLVPRLALSFALASFIGRQAGTEANGLPIISYRHWPPRSRSTFL